MIAVLYVDDEPNLLEIGKLFLEQNTDIRVTAAVSAEEGLAALATGQFDAVVSDYQMAGMDGIAFLKEVRFRSGDVPFILFTGKGREEVVIEAINNGADSYLQKGGDLTSQFAELGHKIKIAVERRRAISALKDSEQRLADIINFLPDATFARDSRGTVIAWNRAIEEMTGIPAGEMLGKGDHEYALPFYGQRRQLLIDLVQGSEDEITRGNYAIIRKEGDIVIAETSAAQVSGRPKIFLCKASLLYDKSGKVAGAIESIRDITEAKKAEEELRAAYQQITVQEEELRGQLDQLIRAQEALVTNEENFQSLVERAPDAIYISVNQRFAYVNPALVRMLGAASPDQLIGMSLYERIHPASHERIRERVRTIVVDHKPAGLREAVYLKMDGTPVDIESAVAPFRYHDQPAGLVILRDITSRKRAEDEIKRLTRKTEEALRIARMGHWEFDVGTGKFIFNDQYYSLHGMTAEEAGGYRISAAEFARKYVHPDESHTVQESIRAALAATDPNFELRFDTRILRADGEPRDTTVWFRIAKDGQGKTVRLYGVTQDITERKQAERKVQDALAFLNALIDQSPNPLWISDEKGFLVRMNAACGRLLNISEEEVVGKYNILQDNIVEKQGFMPLVRSVFEEGNVVSFPLTYDSAELTTLELKKTVSLVLEVTIFPVRDVSGKFTNAVIHHNDITERKRVEDELRLLRASVDQGHDEVFWVDFEGNILYVNDSACRVTGYTREELLAMKIFQLDPDFQPGIWEESVADLRKRKSQLFTTRHLCKNGDIIDVEIMAAYVTRGGREYSFAFVRDITGRKQRETTLQESEEKYRLLIESSFDGVIVHQEGKIVYANRTAERLLGSTGNSSILGMDIFGFVHPDFQELVRQRSSTAKSESQPVVHEKFLRLDGTTIDVDVTAAPFVWKGAPAVHVVFRDVTERKKIENELRESDRRYRLILESANDAIFIHELSKETPGRFIEVNDQACQMLEYTREELLRMSIPDIDVPEMKNESPVIIGKLFSSGSAVFKTENLTKSGRRIPVEVSDRLIEFDGRPAVLSIVRDLREQKRAEQVLMTANRKLNLLNSITRHDIRNRVSVISGYLELAKQKSSDPDIAGFIQKLEAAASSISEQIEFTRIYQDLGTNEPKWQELKNLLHRCHFPPEMTFRVEISDVMVYADPMLEKVFANLLDNTLRHGNHVTTIRVSAEDSPEGLVIRWEDDGVGIPAAEKEKIFLQGYGKNTGLGLFLSREILSITGMTIRESGTGKGARFEITVPKNAYRIIA